MKVNVGTIDRVVRVVIGLVLIGSAVIGSIGWWGYIGVVPLLTGAFSFGPAYTALDINTCPMAKR